MTDFLKHSQTLSVSIVSHGHGQMAQHLVSSLLLFPEIEQIIVTLNIPEDFPSFSSDRVILKKNIQPKGFGANHNAAFSLSQSDTFCVLNPDIIFEVNPFPILLNVLNDYSVGVVAPLVLSADGYPEDSMRYFITPLTMAKRIMRLNSGYYSIKNCENDFFPDWVAGMFMLFQANTYEKVGGFDESYFMYCEDADICTRIWKTGYRVVGCLSTRVFHNAQRASHRSFKHLLWHLRSMARYFVIHSYALPKKNTAIQSG
jgi:GT2 family glycosyltransferase